MPDLGENGEPMSGIRQDVEKKVYEFLSELGDRLGAERVQQLFENAVTGAVRTKKAVDKNVDTLFSMANIPSRRDYDRMRAKLDALQATIMSLNRTVEDLRARVGATNGDVPSPRRRKPKAVRKELPIKRQR